MTVSMRKDMNWTEYFEEVMKQGDSIDFIEKKELSALLLKCDIESVENFSSSIINNDHIVDILSYISNIMIAESPENIKSLVDYLKELTINFYEEKIGSLIKKEISDRNEIDAT